VRQKLSWFAVGAVSALAVMQIWAGMASAYDPYVLNNLKRSRDALLTQQADIQRAYDDTSRQVDVLQQKLAKLDGYLRQLDQALRDVNRAIDQAN
jgi:septal ring factor EnvC (AmiA/AmiB activator)